MLKCKGSKFVKMIIKNQLLKQKKKKPRKFCFQGFYLNPTVTSLILACDSFQRNFIESQLEEDGLYWRRILLYYLAKQN